LPSPLSFCQIGVDPVRIDILTTISQVDFGGAWERRLQVQFGDVQVAVLSREDLIANKKAAGRKQDRLDIRRLQDPRSDRR
jgi:hypothetical protein